MHTLILLSLIVLGANAHWEHLEYSNLWSQPPSNPPSSWEQRRSEKYPSSFSPNILSRDQPRQKITIDAYFTEAEWVCNNQRTGDILILAPRTDQTNEPADEDNDSSEKQDQGIPSQQDITYPSEQTTEYTPPLYTGPHGGEGLINTRIGKV